MHVLGMTYKREEGKLGYVLSYYVYKFGPSANKSFPTREEAERWATKYGAVGSLFREEEELNGGRIIRLEWLADVGR